MWFINTKTGLKWEILEPKMIENLRKNKKDF